jgi:hypothetical protein
MPPEPTLSEIETGRQAVTDSTTETKTERKVRRTTELKRYRSSFPDDRRPSEKLISMVAYPRPLRDPGRMLRRWKDGECGDDVDSSQAMYRLIRSGKHPEDYRKA